jgi:hypothetical protein
MAKRLKRETGEEREDGLRELLQKKKKKKKKLIRPWAWIKEGTSYRRSKRSPTIIATKVW